jgi:hypothetical protein
MKSSKTYWSFIYFLKHIIEILLIFIFVYLFFNIIQYLYNYSFLRVEPFSLPGVKIEIEPPTKMKEAYRPYLRKARLYSEEFFNDSNNYVTQFLRKSGLY